MSIRERLSGLFVGQEELELTSGPIAKPLFYLSLPIVITNLLQVTYNLADTFWLGQYSTVALAAITFGFPLVFLLISLGMGLSVAGSVLVAQYTGADETAEAEYAASQTVTFALLFSATLGLAGFFVVGDFLSLIGASGPVLPPATDYMEVVTLGLPFMFGFIVFIALMRGSGDTITPMLVMLGTVVLNVALDPFLIFGWGPFPELGVQGAAIATVFSRGLAMAVGVAIMIGGRRGIQINVRDMVPDLAYARRLLRIGVPASVEGTSRAVSVNLLLVIVATFSVTVEAAFGVGVRVFSTIFMPAIAVDRGVETMTGQNIGAGKPDRAATANHFAAKASFVILAALGVVTFAVAPAVMSIFSDDPAVISEGANFLRIVAPTFGCIGAVRAYSGGFRGAGKVLTAAGISILMLGLIRLPIAWFGAQIYGPNGVWASFAISNVLAATIAYLWFKRGTWREADLTDDEGEGGEETEMGSPTAATDD
ncbi:MATE family efflux transporter [Halorientalis sp. IM1011]|uniref:MATE family efflux transporter n=1 Tax=Halorientalis sp. IM1011 TaxID=1932360 RepID=UPI00097CC984|nr:MATE family efflux transporter [Halorientalis sp. IM1011]AQL42551.1 MATE family efflux transporter [Halorientalis sp. IM1011]